MMKKTPRAAIAALVLLCASARASEQDRMLQPDHSPEGLQQAAAQACQRENSEALSSDTALPKGLRYERRSVMAVGRDTWKVELAMVQPSAHGAKKTRVVCIIKRDGEAFTAAHMESGGALR